MRSVRCRDASRTGREVGAGDTYRSRSGNLNLIPLPLGLFWNLSVRQMVGRANRLNCF